MAIKSQDKIVNKAILVVNCCSSLMCFLLLFVIVILFVVSLYYNSKEHKIKQFVGTFQLNKINKPTVHSSQTMFFFSKFQIENQLNFDFFQQRIATSNGYGCGDGVSAVFRL